MSRQSTAEVVPDVRRCPECGSDALHTDDHRGEAFCGACGLVLREDAIDAGPEWTAYTSEDNNRRSRTGPPKRALFGASDLMTVIPNSKRDGRGSSISRNKKDLLLRLRTLQYHSNYHLPGERSLRHVARLVAQDCSRLDLPESAEAEAGLICRTALRGGLSRGRSLEETVAGAVYAACRLLGVPRTLDELAEATGVSRWEVGRAYRALRRSASVKGIPSPRPLDYLDRFCSRLGLGNAVRAAAYREIEESEMQAWQPGVAPAGVAAAAIYAACVSCDEPRSEEAIAEVAGVTSATLRHRLRDLERYAKES